MVCAGYLVELLFGAAGLIPTHRNAMVMESGVSWNYTTWLNIAFLALAVVLEIHFTTSGGTPMLRMMGGTPDAEHDRCGDGHNHHETGPQHHHGQRNTDNEPGHAADPAAEPRTSG
jgi:uncharacterized membrane protein YraQ (UPF0718 family)